MKKILLLFIIISFFSCEPVFDERDSLLEIPLEYIDPGENSLDGSNLRSQTLNCGGFFAQSATKLNRQVVYEQDLNISNLAIGEYFSVTFIAKDLPNQFKVYAGSNLVYTSPWLGYSSFPGVWGGSGAVTGPSSLNQTFEKLFPGPYRVEVLGQTAPNSTYSPSTDNWEVWVVCGSGGTPPPPPPPCPGPDPCPLPCPNCYEFLDDSFPTLNSTKIYTKSFNYSCIPIGKKIGFYLNVHDIPNKFQILKNGQPIGDPNAVSPWLGTANYPGQWGWSLSANGTYSITTTREAGAVYTLQVLTQTPPDNVNYSPTTDYWSASLFCGD